MTEPTPETPLPKAVVRQAIAWHLRLESATEEEHATLVVRLDAWCERHPDHRLAWQRVSQLNGEFSDMAQRLPDHRTSVPIVQRASRDLDRRKALKLLLAGCAIGGSGLWLTRKHMPWRADYATGTGERRRIVLADGTQVMLNTASALDVAFDDKQRLLVLRAGEVLVDSGADAAALHRRPLRVQCRFGLCEALGTRFNVRDDEHASRLSIEQGRVEMRHGQGRSRIAESGESYRLDASGIHRLERLTLDPTAWARGMLVVTDIRLDAFVAELARYRWGFLACDTAVAGLRLSGVFQLASPQQVLQHLERTLPVTVASRTDWWIRIEPRA